MYNNLKGIFTALLTPFDGTGKINTNALEQLVEFNIGQGVTGFYVAGSTAEAFLLSEEERQALYHYVANAVRGRAKLIAHIGAISTAQAITFGKTAEKCGYDAVSAIAPFYYKFSFEQIKKHYFDIAEAVKLPMIIYNFPNFSGVNLSVSQVSEFFHDDRFIGIKHTSNDFFALQQFKSKFPEKLVFNGFDEMFLSGLAMGADGAIGSTFNFMADKFIEIKKKFDIGDNAAALEIQSEANRIINALIAVGVMEGEKEVLCQLGMDFGTARPPFSNLDEFQKSFIQKNITDTL